MPDKRTKAERQKRGIHIQIVRDLYAGGRRWPSGHSCFLSPRELASLGLKLGRDYAIIRQQSPPSGLR